MNRRSALICIFTGLVVLTIFMIMNKDWIIREHLANSTTVPTVYSLDKRLEETEKKVDELSTKFNQTTSQMQVQSQQAAAAQATLQAIPTGYATSVPIA